MQKYWRDFNRDVEFNGPPLLVRSSVNETHNCIALADTGCTTYSIINERYVSRNRLQRIPISPRSMRGFDGPREGLISEVAHFSLDVGGNKQQDMYAYIVPRLDGEDIILGLPWLYHQGVSIDAKNALHKPALRLANGEMVPSMSHEPKMEIHQVSAQGFKVWMDRRKKGVDVEIFSVSVKDIEKALEVKRYSDPRKKLPQQYHAWLDVFERKKADTLPPHRGPHVDHKIDLVERDEKGNVPEPPWGPLYNMSRGELLVLRKTLRELLDKQFIRVSSSPAAAPVLFARKPGGGLRFCCDYRALNAISRKDRYPLPLINETLERIGKARWFTKLDVIAAFHKIRIAEGDEWLTAFRTRFGLFEWLVTPFGLANAPSTFQRYVNWTLQEFLDEFVSAYLDDILVFSSGTLHDHRNKVSKVLQRLKDAGLQLDIDKCEFEVQTTKYLGFIVEAGKGVRMDPAKVTAIKEWAIPTTVRGVRSFLGFANFYRRFIRNFADITAPLTALTKKETRFAWNPEADRAFNQLKDMFTTAPILLQFDPDRPTVVEADSSGWATGGVLSQYDDNGILRPCAFFSRKNSPTECNYEIHDKELLAIINCLKEWESELISVPRFVIITDHKNLRYFMQLRRLNERQMRWADTLSRFDFSLQFRPGKLAITPDALSRRDQDMPKDPEDERLKMREKRLINPDTSVSAIGTAFIRVSAIRTTNRPLTAQPVQTTEGTLDNQSPPSDLEHQWNEAEQNDPTIPALRDAIHRQLARFPPELGIRVSIGECEVDADDRVLFRKRRWVPDSEPLRTRLIQEAHDSPMSGHPGHNALYSLLARQLFWPNMSADVKRFVRNCDQCGATAIWRDRRQGLLKPLPVPDRKWREISMDFVEGLPESRGCQDILVVVDRLTKGTILIPCKKKETDYVVQKFLRFVVAYHGLPRAIVSDRGSQFVGALWTRLCQLLRINRRLSTAYHPQTDGQTERMNAVVESYLRNFCNFAQDDWACILPMAQLAMSNQTAASTGLSPFFLDHGFHLETLTLDETAESRPSRATDHMTGERIADKLRNALEVAQAELAAAQERQEHYANRYRNLAPDYKPGDKVWLTLRNIRTNRPSKKLDVRQAKYTVLERVSPHAYRLNTPTGIHPVFHVDLLRPAANDPFPSQRNDDYQPPPTLVDGQEEYHVERILDYRQIRRGRGFQRQYLVKWVGYQYPEWTSAHNMEDTSALDEWEREHPEHGEGQRS